MLRYARDRRPRAAALSAEPNGLLHGLEDRKINVSQRIISQVTRERDASEQTVVTLIGTRSNESAARKLKTAARKETPHEIWFSVTGEARLSPILDWETDDVWTYLGECAAGEHLSYSDFASTMEFYADAGASSCVIVEAQISALVTSHVACVRAVLRHGGMPALERFWTDYKAIGDAVRARGAVPESADVINLPSRKSLTRRE